MDSPFLQSYLIQTILSKRRRIQRKRRAKEQEIGDVHYVWARGEMLLLQSAVMSVSLLDFLFRGKALNFASMRSRLVCWECIVGWAREKVTRSFIEHSHGTHWRFASIPDETSLNVHFVVKAFSYQSCCPFTDCNLFIGCIQGVLWRVKWGRDRCAFHLVVVQGQFNTKSSTQRTERR